MPEPRNAPTTRTSVKLLSSRLDDVKVELDDGTLEERIIMRGVIDPDSFGLIKTAGYQREVLTQNNKALQEAVRNGLAPDIVLGMRGQSIHGSGEISFLQDDVYVIDGRQRLSSGDQVIAAGKIPHLGCAVYFDTTKEFEQYLFERLNLDRVPLSPNITLRNQKDVTEVAGVMYRLANNATGMPFVLCNKICWTQRMSRNELITARTYYGTVGVLMGHAGPGRSKKVLDLVAGLQKIMQAVGKANFQANIRTYFDVVDKAWGIQTVSFKEGATFLKSNFLVSLAEVFSTHNEFWEGNRLVVDRKYIKKLRDFNVYDGYVKDLSGSSGTAKDILVGMIVKQLDHGVPQSRRLTKRLGMRDDIPYDETDEVDA